MLVITVRRVRAVQCGYDTGQTATAFERDTWSLDLHVLSKLSHDPLPTACRRDHSMSSAATSTGWRSHPAFIVDQVAPAALRAGVRSCNATTDRRNASRAAPEPVALAHHRGELVSRRFTVDEFEQPSG